MVTGLHWHAERALLAPVAHALLHLSPDERHRIIPSLAADGGGRLTEPGALPGFDGPLPSPAEAERLAVALGQLHAMLERAETLVGGSRPNPYAFPQWKREATATFGPALASAIFAAATGRAASRALVPATIHPLEAWARATAKDFQLIQPSRPISLRSPEILGAARMPDVVRSCRAMFTATLHEAVVASKSNYIAVDGALLLDAEANEIARCPLDHDVDPVVFLPTPETPPAGLGDVLALLPPPGGADHRLDRAVSLAGIHSFAFGHWILEFLPKIWTLMDRADFSRVVVIVDRQMPAQHMEALRLFLGPAHPVLVLEPGETASVRELLVAPMPIYMPAGPQQGAGETEPLQVTDAAVLVPLLGKATARLPPATAGDRPRRLFMARKPTQHRRLVNQDEIVELLRGHGFVPLDFGELPFRDQLDLVRNAEILVMPDGSSSLLSLLAPPGTRIGLLTHEFLEDPEWYAELSAQLGQRLVTLLGETVRTDERYRMFSDYRVPPAALLRLLETLDAV